MLICKHKGFTQYLFNFGALWFNNEHISGLTYCFTPDRLITLLPAVTAAHAGKTIHWANVGLLFAQRRRRGANIKPTLVQCIVLTVWLLSCLFPLPLLLPSLPRYSGILVVTVHFVSVGFLFAPGSCLGFPPNTRRRCCDAESNYFISSVICGCKLHWSSQDG